MTENRLHCMKKVVGVLAYQWAVVGVSPFWGGAVVGGKGGVVVMMMVGARGRSLREPPFVVIAVHRSGSTLPQFTGV